MKIFVILVGIIIGIITLNHYREEAKKADCLASPACQNRQAMFRSLAMDYPVRSTTGTLFFKGDLCTKDCSGHIAGYKWATQHEILEMAQCSGNSTSFIEGCIAYVSDQESVNREDLDYK